MLADLDKIRLSLGADEPLLTVLSYGIGQDSTSLLYRYAYDLDFKATYAPGYFLVLGSHTGDEHRQTYEQLEYARTFCAERKIAFHFITSDQGYHSQAWATLLTQWRRNNTVGMKAGRKSCTDNLKIQPFYKYLAAYVQNNFPIYVSGRLALERFAQYYGKIRVLIGFTADEGARIGEDSKRPDWQRAAIEMSYPLITMGQKRADCIAYIQSVGHPVPYPSNCQHCPYLSEIELLWLSRNEPAVFEEWVGLEAAKLQKFAYLGAKNYGVFGKRALREVLADAQGKYGQMSDVELDDYKFSHGHCVKSRY